MVVENELPLSDKGQVACDIAANFGWRVHPCCRKRPLLVDWPSRASTDLDVVEPMWREHPDADVGIATGADSGIVVLDVDNRERFDHWLSESGVGLPETAVATTPRGGEHRYFMHPRNGDKIGNTTDYPAGCDIRGDGGNIIAPAGEGRSWVPGMSPLDVDLAPFPLELLKRPKVRNVILPCGVPEGNRNSTLTSLAGSMRRRGFSEVAIRAALLEENRTRCNPPLAETEVARIAASVAKYEPGEASKSPGGTRLIGIRLSDVDVTRPVEWLWKGRIPRNGALTIFDGDPDVGKSTLMSDLVARITTGREMPDGSMGLSGGVVIVTSESAQQVIARQIEVAEGDRSRVQLVTTVGEGVDERPISLPGDLPLLRGVLADVGAVALILDPLLEVIGGARTETDAYKDGDVRRGLTPVRRLCERHNLALIGVRHPTKATGGKAMHKGGGSIAFVAVARAAYYVAQDPGDPDLRVVASTKCNLGPHPRSVGFRLNVVKDLDGIQGAEDDLGVCRVTWEGFVDRTAQELADSPESLSPEQRGVIDALANDCSSIGEVAAHTGRSYSACANTLSRLVKLEHAKRKTTGEYKLTGSVSTPRVIPFSAPPP